MQINGFIYLSPECVHSLSWGWSSLVSRAKSAWERDYLLNNLADSKVFVALNLFGRSTSKMCR